MSPFLDDLLDLLFPPRCCGCRQRGSMLCDRCRDSCRLVPAAANDSQHRRLSSPYLASTAGAYVFDGAVREAIHTLKYNRRTRVAIPLGELLARYLASRPVAIDAIVAVPLYADRERQRGFNQSALLAARLAELTGLPLFRHDLVRVRATSQQADLTRAQRRENVRDAFVWQGSTAPPPRLLLIDDVLTTGATVESAAQALRLAGAQEVHALALARRI
jgi:ComF family protein